MFSWCKAPVSTVRHISSEYKSLDLEKFCREMRIPVIVGNTVGYDVTFEIMECGPAAVLIGVGPGAACTSRGVLGLGVPQVTATVDCAAARDAYFKKTSRYVPIITDGGMSKGGDVCKALACGADAVMVGSAFAKAHEAPGCGYHWGMATPHANLPRGTRIKVGATGSLKQILFGPAEVDDGSQNLGRRDHHLHGQRRRAHHRRVSTNRNHHRPFDQDRRQTVPDGAKRRNGNKVKEIAIPFFRDAEYGVGRFSSI